MSRSLFWNTFWGAMIVGGIGGMYLVSVTQIVTSMVSEWGFSDQQAGMATTMHTLGSLLGMIYIFFWIDRLDIRKSMLVALVATAICEGIVALSGDPTVVISIRLFAGIASGMAFSMGLALLGYLPNSERLFALAMAASFVTAVISLSLWPTLLEWWGLEGIFWLYSITTVLCLPFIRLLPISVKVFESSSDPMEELGLADLFRGAPLVITLAYLLFYVGNTAIWTFAAQIGTGQGLPLEEVTELLSLSLAAGFSASLLATWIGNRMGYSISLLIGMGVIFGSSFFMFEITDGNSYLLAFALFNFGFSFAIPYFQGVQSTLDPSGRLLIIGLMTVSAGFFFGPALASLLLDGKGYDNLYWMGAACFGLALVAVQLVVLRGLGKEGQSAGVSQTAS
ncbi:MFS transporter [Parendozoicomonas haliclonae]|uniref:Major Facilitator Superfamily protein n=1 Tax=Parendozoicomonas haliclonae TaxID=1960125 RepID=A0A1X7APC8_9GAMM|nr:MFS transporter [Parendozoicomonas haliclonae]SMA49939.1 Major Facilitator Superfamily protein [Parendozoicomonas haliclonae]